MMWWFAGALYGAAVWVVLGAAKGKSGWRLSLMRVGLLVLPVIPIVNVFAGDVGILLPFVVGAAIAASVLAAGNLALRTQANRAANRAVPLSDEAADRAFKLIIRDQRARLAWWTNARWILVVLVGSVLLVGLPSLVAVSDPELAAGGTLDGLFAASKWVGIAVSVLVIVVYASGLLLFRLRSLWRTLALNDREFGAAQRRFEDRAGI